MFTIVKDKTHGLQLQNDAGATFPIGEIVNLLDLHREIGHYLQQKGKTEYISTFRARKLATAEGYNVPTNSITTACERGNILNAKKSKGRWQMPVTSWEQWYNAWKDRKAAKNDAHLYEQMGIKEEVTHA